MMIRPDFRLPRPNINHSKWFILYRYEHSRVLVYGLTTVCQIIQVKCHTGAANYSNIDLPF